MSKSARVSEPARVPEMTCVSELSCVPKALGAFIDSCAVITFIEANTKLPTSTQ